MKKVLVYILGFFACAWLINWAIKLLMEVWQVLFIGATLLNLKNGGKDETEV